MKYLSYLPPILLGLRPGTGQDVLDEELAVFACRDVVLDVCTGMHVS